MRKHLLLIMLLASIVGLAQTSAGPDQTICIDDITTLQGSGSPFDTYLWTSIPNDPTISNPTILTPTVQPSTTTTYTLEGRNVSTINLVVNGNFEDGNVGFTSEYIYSPGPNGIWNEGTYAITTDAHYNHNNFSCNEDHTTGTGNFMVVNGASQNNQIVWSETIQVSPNSEYEFSTWIESLSSSNPALLQFSINGNLLGLPFNASSTTCVWDQFFEQWNSGSSSSAVISIVNKNLIANGNDFSLDDIKFALVSYIYDDCIVTVNDFPTSDFDMSTTICSADTATVTYTGTASASAQYNWDFDNATIISGSGQGPYQLQWSNAGNHTVTLSVDNGCLSDPTSNDIFVNQSPTATLTADATTINYGTNTTLHGLKTGAPGPLIFEWDPITELENPISENPTTINLEQSTLFTYSVTDQSSLCAAYDTITIKVVGGILNILSLTAIPDTICDGESSTLIISIEGGSGDYISTWSSDLGGFIYSGPENQITVTPTENTTYFVEVFDGYTTTPLSSVSVTVLPQIEILLQAGNLQIEEGQSAIFTIEANNQNYFQWQESNDNGISWIDLQDDATYSGTQTNQLTIINVGANYNLYQYRCRLEGYCNPINSNAALLSVNSTPDFIGSLQDVSVCEAEVFAIACNITNFINIDSLSLCFNFDSSLLQFSQLDNIHTGLSNINVTSAGDSVCLSWNSNTALSISDGHLFDLVFVALDGGEAPINWSELCILRNYNGVYPDLIFTLGNVSITPLPTAPDFAMGTPDSLSILDEIDIALETTGGSGSELIWTSDSCNGNNIGYGTPLNIYRPEETTTYYARWETQCGLSDCVETTVTITQNFVFMVPNAFTPNGDGINDNFGVITPNTLPFLEFYIYNRWGQLIFTSDDQYNKWDGTYESEIAPLGTYVWVVNYQFRNEGIGSELYKDSGTVTLVR